MMMKNITEYKPDIRKAMNAADELLLAAIVVTSFPYSVTDLIRYTTDIQVRSFQYLRQKGINPLAFGSEDALIFSYNGMTIMAYDRMALKTTQMGLILSQRRIAQASRIIVIRGNL